MQTKASRWTFAVDRGGTFTDVIGVDQAGEFHILKLLSHSSQYRDASIEGIKRVLKIGSHEPLPEKNIDRIRFGTTVVTNALLERKGGVVALFITKGFSDLLEIGYQVRPDIFQLCIKKAGKLYSYVAEMDERIDHRGNIIKNIDTQLLLSNIVKLKESRIDTIAVVLMHSWKNPVHELLCEKILHEHGIHNVILSHKTINLIKIISRGQSTLVDAYLSTELARYREGIKKETGKIPVEFMQSNGILTNPLSFKAKNALFSGPAGGVIAAAEVAKHKGIKGVIGFDMGGTSTDVSRFDGTFEKRYEQTIGNIPLQVEMLDIITVAAGGGSILHFDGQRMISGPKSAGAYPGPACYGFGGPLTITDANLFTGRIVSQYFPMTFGSDGNSSIDSEIVEEKFYTLTREINRSMVTAMTPQAVAHGFLKVANEKMAMAIKEISVSRGFDIRDYALVCFGGAGGQHVCSLASLLDMKKIIVHPLSGVMSAYGIGLSKPAWKTEQSILSEYTPANHEKISHIFRNMEEQVISDKDIAKKDFTIKKEIDLRPKGAEAFLSIEYRGFSETVREFKEQHERRYGFSLEETALEVVNVKIEIQQTEENIPHYRTRNNTLCSHPEPLSFQEIHYAGGTCNAPVFQRELLPLSVRIQGPCIVLDDHSTVIIDPGYSAEIDETGVLMIVKSAETRRTVIYRSRGPDPVLLEVFHSIFMGIATEMGLTLKNTAHSVNMKERLDFSCALFDSAGNLVANAPHIPVHLGSMADTIKAVMQERQQDIRPGDMYLTNNPYRGGSHLSDMTVICPVFSESGKLIFFTAVRGHHADVGGKTPGSMPPLAENIDEEGVLVDNFLLVRDSEFNEDALIRVLSDKRYPARNIPERICDFKAQMASCQKGMNELLVVLARFGLNTVIDYMRYIQENAEYEIKKALSRFLTQGVAFFSSFEDFLDDGTMIKVAISIDGGEHPPNTLRAVVDFNGTGAQHLEDNLNAPRSVTHSAVLYALMTLIQRDIPLNSGCLKPVKIIIPPSSVLNPTYPAPVASGNVETSQRIVDALLGALGIAAASQGTMNNFLFQVDGESPYYETIAGGAGALEGCHGASGVQVHMTNTRTTDPEIFEFRHPGVRITQFSLRRRSGGRGSFSGGDGIIKEVMFLKPATVSLITERRIFPPYGIRGGEAGKKGVNLLRKMDGEISQLGHRKVLRTQRGDSIIIQTPGGGGYGRE